MDDLDEQIAESLQEVEPQVTSSDPGERKLARKLRIERRLEAIRRQLQPEEEEVENEKEKTITQQQIERSVDVLKKLLAEGEERVTNIMVASDARETDRRESEGINREKIIKALEDEAELAEEQFKHISEKWFNILKSNDPLHINDKMIQQKEKCEELIKQKDGIIAMLKEEIAVSEKKFASDQRKQIDDISLLSNRIEKQIALTRRAYREQLKLIEECMQVEQKILMESNDKKWEELYKKRDQEEIINSEKQSEQMEYFDQEMTKLRRDFQEKFRETKIKMERDIDELEQELERIKALALLNSEKLDYNYQILKKREDENIIIKSQQKRRINKLQDIVNTLKRKITDYSASTKQQVAKISAEIAKLQQSILDIESKADHFAEINDVKFNQLWDMNTERVLEVAGRILTIDKILHEQLLGLEWNEKGLLKRKELRKENLPSYREALEILQKEALATEPQKTLSLNRNRAVVKMDAKKEAVRANLLRRILKQLADRAGFIIEDRLQQILEPYLDEEKTLIRMDNVFSALNITKEADIDELIEYFLPYAHCPVCAGAAIADLKNEGVSELEIEVVNADVEHEVTTVTIVPSNTSGSKVSKSSGSARETDRDHQLVIPTTILPPPVLTTIVNDVVDQKDSESVSSEEQEEEAPLYETLDPLENMPPQKEGKKDDTLSEHTTTKMDMVEERLSCQFQHPLLISSVYILKALKHFVNNYYTQKAGLPTMGARLAHKRNTICRLVKESDIKMYWEQFKNIFTAENESIWDALAVGLTKYHEILKDRAKVNDEVVELRKENERLKILLGKYLENPKDPNLEPPCLHRNGKLPIRTKKS